jgi:nucleotide-binding universal stress UspA family protein
MKMLIPLDGSQFAEAILKPAADLAAAARAEVYLIEVVRPSEAKDTGAEGPSPNPRLYQAAEKYLNGVAQQFFPDGATSKIVISEHPAKEVLDYARRERIDLIAMATHGRTGLARIMLGSVAGELLKVRIAPIFMVRPEGLYE